MPPKPVGMKSCSSSSCSSAADVARILEGRLAGHDVVDEFLAVEGRREHARQRLDHEGRVGAVGERDDALLLQRAADLQELVPGLGAFRPRLVEDLAVDEQAKRLRGERDRVDLLVRAQRSSRRAPRSEKFASSGTVSRVRGTR